MWLASVIRGGIRCVWSLLIKTPMGGDTKYTLLPGCFANSSWMRYLHRPVRPPATTTHIVKR